jgi:hypothetical protein
MKTLDRGIGLIRREIMMDRATRAAILIIMGACLFMATLMVKLYPVFMQMAELMEIVLGGH